MERMGSVLRDHVGNDVRCDSTPLAILSSRFIKFPIRYTVANGDPPLGLSELRGTSTEAIVA